MFAVDRAGQRSQTRAVDIFIDADAPILEVAERAAPILKARTTKRPRRKRALLRAKKKGATFSPNPVFALAFNEPLGFSLDGIEWRPLSAMRTNLLTDSSTLQLAVNDGYCLRADASQEATAANDACGTRYLTLTAADDHTGVKVLSTRIENSTLIIEASDEVGNTSELRYRIVSN